MTAAKIFELQGQRVWVAGDRGMVGSALMRRLAGAGCTLLTARRAELDLRDQRAVDGWLAQVKPDAIFLAAATVGRIHANNTRPAEFIYDNLAIETNVNHAAWPPGGRRLSRYAACPGTAALAKCRPQFRVRTPPE